MAIWIGERRWVSRGGTFGDVQDLAIWMVPFGLVGGRLYHVITDYELYFGEGRNPVTALYVWRGGLGIWGAVALGALGVAIGARRKHIGCCPCSTPSLPPSSSVRRWGGGATGSTRSSSAGRPTLPWALEIDEAHRPAGYFDVRHVPPDVPLRVPLEPRRLRAC